jgi:hypothetical protein
VHVQQRGHVAPRNFAFEGVVKGAAAPRYGVAVLAHAPVGAARAPPQARRPQAAARPPAPIGAHGSMQARAEVQGVKVARVPDGVVAERPARTGGMGHGDEDV